MDARSRGNPPEWDVMRAAGRRDHLITLVDHGLSQLDGYYLPDVFEYLDGWTLAEHSDAGEEACRLWLDIRRSCHQCVLLMSLAPTAERAERVLATHQQNLEELYMELRVLCERGGWIFAVKGVC